MLEFTSRKMQEGAPDHRQEAWILDSGQIINVYRPSTATSLEPHCVLVQLKVKCFDLVPSSFHLFSSFTWPQDYYGKRQSKIVSRATGKRAVISVDHSRCARCAVVLKEIQRYHGPGLWAWRKIFSPLRGTNSTTTHCHIFLVQYPDRYHRGCCCGPFEAEQPKRY